ncbi:hypothetical protein GNI_060460 [Gregarina niphandrodes]|uniref:Uncharacterized protein n=1 Tax=Gregarina niphandrodes TaxID=110365 RepID=A0A023B8G4_GRENI|nr:hypothetical protein GNI_060460 [Gregarina niphandrodes]EZG68990.1 hypothetical protein GNI_060460 [Gregarina niphandrodes]|eukprot:XP_011134508.1 hypothetical protein GNI_060460 [Gregarina niphandrodes]
MAAPQYFYQTLDRLMDLRLEAALETMLETYEELVDQMMMASLAYQFRFPLTSRVSHAVLFRTLPSRILSLLEGRWIVGSAALDRRDALVFTTLRGCSCSRDLLPEQLLRALLCTNTCAK